MIMALMFSNLVHAAGLNCRILEGRTPTASARHAISNEGDPSSFKFNLDLSGTDFEGKVDWDTKYISLFLKKKSDALGALGYMIWKNPLEDLFFVDHGGATLSCSVDVNDRLSWLWSGYRKEFEEDTKGINDVMGSIARIARLTTEDPKEDAEVNSAACFIIGHLQNEFWVKDLLLKLLGFDTVVGRSIFPDAYAFYRDLQMKIMGMANFCGLDVVQDPSPIGYQNRGDLARRCEEIVNVNSDLLRYLDTRFPNGP